MDVLYSYREEKKCLLGYSQTRLGDEDLSKDRKSILLTINVSTTLHFCIWRRDGGQFNIAAVSSNKSELEMEFLPA